MTAPPGLPAPPLRLTRGLALIVAAFVVATSAQLAVTVVALRTMSAARAYVAGEGQWARARLEAVSALHRYANTRNPQDFEAYERALDVTLGDRRARLALKGASPDHDAAREGFLAGRNHPDDIPGMVRLFRWFRYLPEVDHAIAVWEQGDASIDRLRDLAAALRAEVMRAVPQPARMRSLLEDVDRVDRELSQLGDEFSASLGRAARWASVALLSVTSAVAILLVVLAVSFSWRVLACLEKSEQALRDREARLQEAQKLRAVGQLADGIAHDFNNLLTVILGYADALQHGLGPAHPEHAATVEISRAAERAASLTHQLLAFSRRQPVEPVLLDLNMVLAELQGMLERLAGPQVRLTVLPGATLGLVRADRSQIERVIVNLAANARDAMAFGGRLRIETSNDVQMLPGGGAPVPCVVLEMIDTGEGMSRETRARIFEPFFTTRPIGKGTGLGLAVAYGTVHQAGGRIDVESDPGRGARFRVILPRAAAAATAVAPLPEAPLSVEGFETILVVEDDDAVRELTRSTLARHGYHVLVARDADEALSLATTHTGRIDLLHTDIVMPGLGGAALAERLTAERPGLPVLFVSGYADAALGQDGTQSVGERLLLRKPFTPQELVRKVRQTLDAHRRAESDGV